MAAADADDIRPAEAEAVADEPPPPAGLPPGMPPADESGFPSLPMFGGEINELFSSLSAAQSVFSLNTALRDGVMTSGMAMLSENASHDPPLVFCLPVVRTSRHAAHGAE